MRPGAVIVDVAVDQGGCIETTHETTHNDPVYEEHGVIHYAVGNMPGAVPHTSTYALTNATLPYVLEVATPGPVPAPTRPWPSAATPSAARSRTPRSPSSWPSPSSSPPRRWRSVADMKLGYGTGYWGSGPPVGALEAIIEAERLGFDSVWTAEAYGSDALTPLAWWGAHTTLKLGTTIIQLSARTPAATAMAAMTLDHLSGGRFILGLGASGPQVVEGWYGQPYPKPLARTREYVAIVRRSSPARSRSSSSGRALPAAATRAALGLGKPLKSTMHPLRADMPIYLAAEGPKNVALAAEICDGWLPLFFSPKSDGFYRAALAEGFARPGARRTADDFEVAATMMIVPGDDVERCADMIRPMLALYAGGMGARGTNFHFDVFARLGYEAECLEIQDLYLGGNKADAIAAVPLAHGRGPRADRAARQDQGGAAALEGDLPDDDARLGARGDAARDGGAALRLTAASDSRSRPLA